MLNKRINSMKHKKQIVKAALEAGHTQEAINQYFGKKPMSKKTKLAVAQIITTIVIFGLLFAKYFEVI